MPASAPELFQRAAANLERTAIIDGAEHYSYDDLLSASSRVAKQLLGGSTDLGEARVAFLVAPGFEYVAIQWGIWRAGGVAVPLAISHPLPELDYTVSDSEASILVCQAALSDRLHPVAESRDLPLLTTEDLLSTSDGAAALPELSLDRRAMILYTSGTTSRPKGVVTTHGNIQAQVESLVDAWEWTRNDRTLLVLPLHHVHGIINVLTCALWSGATCTIHPGFVAESVWEELTSGRLTLFMAVPTIYSKLIGAWEAADDPTKRMMSARCRALRLMVSGSAALPVSMLERWRAISGHTLLERYGMTEIGMALSNPLHGERRPGHVGYPLPGVHVRLSEDDGSAPDGGVPGEIEVRGATVFQEYWKRPEATEKSFRDGWFRTGDVAVVDDGYYRILGRSSVDILKTGGYKVSALEIEEVLRTHPDIAECAVVGVEDPEWGERVCVALVASSGSELSAADLRGWAGERLAPYKVPRAVLTVETLPRNAMGKVMKPEVKRLFAE